MPDRSRFSLRSMSLDLEQALLRVLVTAVVVLYLMVFGDAVDRTWLVLAFAYLSVAVGIVVMVIREPRTSAARRIVGMVFDMGGATYILVAFGEVGAPAVFVYFWVTIGNGFRWGIQYLFVAMGLSILGMSVALLLSEYWQANPYLYVGITLSLLIVPLFVSRLLKRLNEAIEREQVANQYKSQFLANMSHELRTPLHGVIGSTDLLLASNLTATQAEHVQTINTSADTLLSIVDDVLDISKIEAGRYELQSEQFDLPALIKNTIQVVSHQARHKGLSISLLPDPEVPTRIEADPGAIRQVLLNLLSNAVKFTSVGGIRILVNRSSLSDNGNATGLRVEVADTGIGIPADTQQEIFKLFTQGDGSITRRFGGAGLGMAISKQLVEMMGGEIGVRSEPGKGSTFWFVVPVAATDAPATLSNTWNKPRIAVAASARDGAIDKVLTALSGVSDADIVNLSVGDLVSISPDYDAIVAIDTPNPHLRSTLCTKLGNEARSGPGVVWVGDSPPADLFPNVMCVVKSAFDNNTFLKALLWTAKTKSGTVPSLSNHPRCRKILVADDQKSNRTILANILSHGGYQVRTAEDGKEALRALRDEVFDAAVIDYHMPGNSGTSIVRQYQDIEPDSKTRFMILTADATLKARQECENAGVLYLTKPIRGTTLLQEVARLLEVDQPAGLDAERVTELISYYPSRTAVGETFEDFWEDAGRRVTAMRGALSAPERAALRDHAHALKGSSEFIGARRLAHLCATIERQHQTAGEGEVDSLRNELERVRLEFRTLLNNS